LTMLFSHVRFRTRLALVLLLVLAVTSGVLFATYILQNRRIKAYVAGITSDLLAISQLTQKTIQPTVSRTQALKESEKAVRAAGLSVAAAGLSVAVASPSGEVVYSTNPRQVGKKIKIKRGRRIYRQGPIEISAELPAVDVDTGVHEEAYYVQFPIVQGDKVIGYVRVRGFGDQFDALLRRADMVRSFWILTTLLLGILATVYLAFLFTKPIDMLVEGARQVAAGNLYVSLPVKRRDEIGHLAQTFNQMVERLRQNRQLQERLNEAEKMSLLGHFAGSVAHEVRNSLNFINLSIDQARAKQTIAAAAGNPGTERAGREVQRNLANVKEEINRLNRLINGFLSAGRQNPPNFEACDLREALHQAVRLVEKQAHSQDVHIDVALPAHLPQVQADCQQLETCFVNVLTNAIQAMPDGGRITVTGSSKASDGGPERIQLAFADTGPGVPTQNREKIFAPFFSTKTTGFGLGLAITRKIVQDHGGSIYIRGSEQSRERRSAPGEAAGTVMVIELPLNRAAARPAETSPAPPPVPAISN
jgi:signal transduction histidine kinase